MIIKINGLSGAIGSVLLRKNLLITTAESCTGGAVAQAITETPGSSQWFSCSFVTYSNVSKQNLLGVSTELLKKEGAVSEAVVKAMAVGARKLAVSDVAIAVSGIAGPEGGSDEKPVGTVWIAWSLGKCSPEASAFHFKGDRHSVRSQAVCAALSGVYERLLKDQYVN